MTDVSDGAKAAPPGFALTPSRGKFTIHNGPTYRASAAGDLRAGMYVLARHCNGMGFLHGGMVSAFADSALAWAVFNTTEKFGVTIKLALEFMDTVSEGDWIEAHTEVTAVDGELVHVVARIVRPGGALVARADAVFRLLRRKYTRPTAPT
jgi:uncharacterized protein (TIGR00369 family)